MKPVQKILSKALVKEFYRETAGVFVFFFVVMFGVVGILHYATFWTYHYTLIMGMLNNPGIFGFILIAWFLYARKCAAFVTEKMRTPEYSFLQVLTRLDKRSCSRAFVVMQVLLYLPILIYTIFIFIVAFYHHYFISILIIILYHSAICYLGPVLYQYQLHNPEGGKNLLPRFQVPGYLQKSYTFILFRYMFSNLKMIVTGIKIFTCGILFLLAGNNAGNYYDLQFPFLFFSFGLLANGIVVHRLRHLEERELSFYRGMPVAIGARFFQYALMYLIYFIPEIITILLLAPNHLHYTDAVTFALCGYGILLMLNSISLIAFFDVKVYLRIVLVLYAVIYLFVATWLLASLYMVLLSLSTVLFILCYYRYEHSD